MAKGNPMAYETLKEGHNKITQPKIAGFGPVCIWLWECVKSYDGG